MLEAEQKCNTSPQNVEMLNIVQCCSLVCTSSWHANILRISLG
jgi:hypothetical protein